MGEVIEVTAHYGRRCAVVVTPKMTAKQIEPLSSLLDRLAAFVVHLVEQQPQP